MAQVSIAAGKVPDASCRGCGREKETIGHLCFACDTIGSTCGEEEEGPPMPEELTKLRDSIMEHGTLYTPNAEVESFELSVGIPRAPGKWEHAFADPPVQFWGTWEGDRAIWP
eukprot:7658640-Pyramimonas_sp.AAC.1